MALWRWNKEARRYIVTSEGAATLGRRAGSFISADSLVGQRGKFIESQQRKGQSTTDAMLDERITIAQWVNDMRQDIKDAHMAQYMLAVGGRNQMTPADYGRVGAALRSQYGYLNNFANEILSGNLSDAQIRARANMYFKSSNASFERGKAASIGVPQLPQYPGDGQTACKTNCNCTWIIDDTDDAWLCYWRLRPGESCEDCIDNAATWNPLRVVK